jgi:hypothetical protein
VVGPHPARHVADEEPFKSISFKNDSLLAAKYSLSTSPTLVLELKVVACKPLLRTSVGLKGGLLICAFEEDTNVFTKHLLHFST